MCEINIRKIFGENVKYYRKKRGLSQEQLAEKLDLSPNHISVIETGGKFVTYKHLEKIVQVLDVTPADLFFTENNMVVEDRSNELISKIIKSELDEAYERIQKELNLVNCQQN